MTTSTALPTGWETSPRAQELRTYEAHKAELLRTAKGKYVLIKDTDVVGLYEREADAFSEGHQRFRLTGFSVRQVSEQEKVYTIGGSSFEFIDAEDEDAAT